MSDPLHSLPMARIMALSLPWLLLVAAVKDTALAEPGVNTVSVPYADLDLTQAKGRAEFEARLTAALRKVCRVPFTRSARAATQAKACMKAAREKVARQRAVALAHRATNR